MSSTKPEIVINFSLMISFVLFCLTGRSVRRHAWVIKPGYEGLCTNLGQNKDVKFFRIKMLLFNSLFLEVSPIIITTNCFSLQCKQELWLNLSSSTQHTIFYCIHQGYLSPVLEFEFRIGAKIVNS